jgi:hypothetical protein
MNAEELKAKLDDVDRLAVQDIITNAERLTQRAALLAEYTRRTDPVNQPPPPLPPPPAPIVQAEPAPPPAPVKKSGGSGVLKWGLFGCLGMLAGVGLLVVLGIVLIAAAIGSADNDAKAVLTGDAADVIVHMTGDPGVKFSGNLGGPAGQRSVDGTTPMDFTIPGTDSSGIFVAVMQKQVEPGHLVVTMTCQGGDKSGETTAAYGGVTVTCSPY